MVTIDTLEVHIQRTRRGLNRSIAHGMLCKHTRICDKKEKSCLIGAMHYQQSLEFVVEHASRDSR